MGNRVDLTGKRFGNLTVLGIDRSGEHKYWKCICDCGNIKIASTSYLLSGTTKSCGHERKNKNKKPTPRSKNPLTKKWKKKNLPSQTSANYKNKKKHDRKMRMQK